MTSINHMASRLTLSEKAVDRERGAPAPKRPQRPSNDTRFLRCLFGLYGVWWIVMAVSPNDRFDWALENLLVFLLWGVLWASRKTYPLTRGAYILIVLFLALHAMGAHYTYAETPFGDFIAQVFNTERNHYDRIVHFAFGLLWVVPFKIFLEHYVLMPGKESWCAFLAINLVLSLSGLYELIEWTAALILDPNAALAFLGAQGDPFDGQKDAGLAFLGSLLGILLFNFWPANRKHLRP